ncbi:MAG: hypothetical protein ACKO10_05385 [Betaproteobacteria bacterium]
MKRTTFERPDTHQVYGAAAGRARVNEATVTDTPSPTPAVPPTMSEKQSLLALLGCRKEIAAGEFSVKLNHPGFHWTLPLDVTTRFASELKSAAEWKGMILTSRQGYFSVDAAHSERRFPRLRADLMKISGSGKVEANYVCRYLDKLAAGGIYDQLLLTTLSPDTRLAANLAVLCWSDNKVYGQDVSKDHEWIIENLKAEKEARGPERFEKDVQALLPLLRPATQRKGQSQKMRTQFTVTQLKLLVEHKILNNSLPLLLEIYLAGLKYDGRPSIRTFREEMGFVNDIIRDVKITDLLPLAAMGSEEFTNEIFNQLRAMPPEKRKESILDIYLALEYAFEYDQLSFLKHNEAWNLLTSFIVGCIKQMKELSFDEKLMRACTKVTGSAYRYTEKLGVAPSNNLNQQAFFLLKNGAELCRHLQGWIETLPPFEATEVLNELPAYYRDFLRGPMQ